MADIAEQNDSPLVEAVIPAGVTEVAEAPVTKNKSDRGGLFWGTGRRKSSVARVRIRPGKGEILIMHFFDKHSGCIGNVIKDHD